VVVSDCIANGIVAAGENSEPATPIYTNRKALDIGNFYTAYQKIRKLQQKLRDIFAETVYADRLPDIENILKTGTSPKVIYWDSMRHFGLKGG